MARLVLIGEGATEVGKMPRVDKLDLTNAVLPQLLARFLVGEDWQDQDALPFIVTAARPWVHLKVHGPRKKKIQDRKVALAMQLAAFSETEAIVFLLDKEKYDGPDRREAILKAVDDYKAQSGFDVVVVVGAPSRSVETWLLVDDDVRAEVLGPTADSPFSGDPERRPPPRTLKTYIDDHAREAHMTPPETRRKLAARSRPEVLEQQCPTSYGPFAADIRDGLVPLSGA